MSVDRLTRLNALLKREIAESLFHVMNAEPFDLAAVTITHVITNRDLRSARVLVSIRDHTQDRRQMLDALRRHRGEIQDLINRDLVLKYTPRLTFELDLSIERGDRILGLLAHMEEPPPEGTP